LYLNVFEFQRHFDWNTPYTVYFWLPVLFNWLSFPVLLAAGGLDRTMSSRRERLKQME